MVHGVFEVGFLAVCLILKASVSSALSVIPALNSLPADTVRAACRTRLAANITQCDNRFALPLNSITNADLPEICTASCGTAMSTLYSAALTACGNTSIWMPIDDLVPPTTVSLTPFNLAAAMVYRYNSASSRSGSTLFCKQLLNSTSESVVCSDCYLKQKQLQLNDPNERIGEDPAVFQSIKQSCGVATASYPVTYTPTPVTVTGSALPTCAKSYVAKAGDTANSVSLALKVSTDRLLQYNSIPLDINGTFTSGAVLCLDEVPQCLTRKVVVTDTCSTLLTLIGFGLSEVILKSWNPTLGYECRNLKNMVGKNICISPPGQTTSYSLSLAPTITPTPTPEKYTWVPATETLGIGNNYTKSYIFPSQTLNIKTISKVRPNAAAKSAAAARLISCPFLAEEEDSWQDGLAEDEYRLHSWDLPESCMDLHWNKYCQANIATPVQPSPTTIPASCSPTVSKIIPVGFVKPPAPTNSGSPALCNKWYVVKAGDGCSGIASSNSITLAQFYAWNPSVGSDCRLLKGEFAYCVRVWAPSSISSTTSVATTTTPSGPPGPTATGTSGTCTKYHVRKSTDTCDSIATLYGILVTRFRQLNRSVTTACDNLITGNAYCVA